MPGLSDWAVDEDVVYGGGPANSFDRGVVGGGAWWEDPEVVV